MTIRAQGGDDDASPPPDRGLQAERTSLSWARTWALVALIVVMEIRLVGQYTATGAAILAVALIAPAAGLMRVQTRHEQRIRRFRRGGDSHQTQWLLNAALVALIVVLAGIGVGVTVVTGMSG